jgi:hypothetical protein
MCCAFLVLFHSGPEPGWLDRYTDWAAGLMISCRRWGNFCSTKCQYRLWSTPSLLFRGRGVKQALYFRLVPYLRTRRNAPQDALVACIGTRLPFYQDRWICNHICICIRPSWNCSLIRQKTASREEIESSDNAGWSSDNVGWSLTLKYLI